MALKRASAGGKRGRARLLTGTGRGVGNFAGKGKPAEMVAGLTIRQRLALAHADGRRNKPGHLYESHAGTLRALERRGLIEPAADGWALTTLGAKVAALLPRPKRPPS